MYGAEIIRQLKISTQKIVNDHQSLKRREEEEDHKRKGKKKCAGMRMDYVVFL